jgi:epsin
VELLSDVEKIRTERKKAKTTKNKYVGVGNEGMSFGNFDVSSGSRYGGFGNDSLTSSSYGNYGNGGFRCNIEMLLALIVRLQFRWKQ